MDLMELVKSQLSGQVMESLTKQIGASDSSQTQAAADGILSTLTAAIAKNAQDPNKAEQLNKALEKDHDGSLLDNLSGFLEGNAGNDRASNGDGILKHILGDKKDGAAGMISESSGLSQEQTGSLMEKLAPLLMGALGQQKSSQGLDSSGLSSVLGGFLSSDKAQSNPLMGMATKFLDKDGDGNITNELTGMIGSFFKK